MLRPVSGPGVILANARGGQVRRICGDAGCGVTGTPRWSPDGRLIAVATSGTTQTGPMLRLLYSDGSCFDCALAGTLPAFGSTSEALTSISGGFVHESRIDGLENHVLYRAPITDAVTSSQGRVAVVRRGRVQIQTGGHLAVVGTGSEPTWSANGSRLAFVHRGWIEVIDLRRRRTVRLTRGSSPAWAPDGRSIAYVGAGHSVRVIAPSGGRSRPAGRLHGRPVDWQPVLTTPPGPCNAIPGASVAASSAAATLTRDPANAAADTSSAVLGCRTADGRQRVLTHFYGGGVYRAQAGFTEARLAGDYAALVTYTNVKADHESIVEVFDLRTGQSVPPLGNEQPPGSCCGQTMDQLQLNDQGITAVHADVDGAEQIIASDHTGLHVLDTAQSSSTTPALTNLTLTGDTLTWQHDGQPESATLS